MRLLAAFIVALPLGAHAAVTISEVSDEGIDCFQITTDSATYFYDKVGAGFTSLLDRDGVDWINFHPEGSAPNGESGWYRGIPNMGLDVFGHPGYTGAVSTTSDPLGVALASATVESVKGGWQVRWEFFDDHARMTVLSVEENYWFLYEGTPGGAVGADDLSLRPDGSSVSLGGSWEGDVVNNSGWASGSEWVLFADGTLDRSLFLLHDDDALTDRYYLMDPMTVFGFGRHSQDLDRLMSDTPAVLMVGLVETRELSAAGPILDALYSGVPPADGGPAGDGTTGGDGATAGDWATTGDGATAGDSATGGDRATGADGATPADGVMAGDGGAIGQTATGSCACDSTASIELFGFLVVICLARRRRG